MRLKEKERILPSLGLLAGVFMLALLGACRPSEDTYHLVVDQVLRGTIPALSPSEVSELPTATRFVDARTADEFGVSHLPGARNVENYHGWLPEDCSTPVVVYCTIGYRSEKVGEMFRAMGYTHVYNLYGGLISWKNSGYRVVNAAGVETDSIHGYSPVWGRWLTNGISVYGE